MARSSAAAVTERARKTSAAERKKKNKRKEKQRSQSNTPAPEPSLPAPLPTLPLCRAPPKGGPARARQRVVSDSTITTTLPSPISDPPLHMRPTPALPLPVSVLRPTSTSRPPYNSAAPLCLPAPSLAHNPIDRATRHTARRRDSDQPWPGLAWTSGGDGGGEEPPSSIAVPSGERGPRVSIDNRRLAVTTEQAGLGAEREG